MFTNPSEARTYTLAGKAKVTLTSKVTGKHLTYKVSQAQDRETRQPQNRWFVALLTGPDNENDFTYLGMINGGHQFGLTKASKFAADSTPVRAFAYFWRHLTERGVIPNDLEVRHNNSCGRCGRELTTPDSIDSGLGPICRAEMGL